MKNRINRLVQLLKTAPRKNLLALAGLLIITAAVPFTVAVQQLQQNLQQKAASPGDKSSNTMQCGSVDVGYTCPYWYCVNGTGFKLAGGTNNFPTESKTNVSCSADGGHPATNMISVNGKPCYYQTLSSNNVFCGYIAPTPAPTAGAPCLYPTEQFCNGTAGFFQCSSSKVWVPYTCSGSSATNSVCHDNGISQSTVLNDVSCVCPSGTVLNSAKTACVTSTGNPPPTALPPPASTAVGTVCPKSTQRCMTGPTGKANNSAQTCNTTGTAWGTPTDCVAKVCQTDYGYNSSTPANQVTCLSACTSGAQRCIPIFGVNSATSISMKQTCTNGAWGAPSACASCSVVSGVATCGGGTGGTGGTTKYACNSSGQCAVSTTGTFTESTCGGTCTTQTGGSCVQPSHPDWQCPNVNAHDVNVWWHSVADVLLNNNTCNPSQFSTNTDTSCTTSSPELNLPGNVYAGTVIGLQLTTDQIPKLQYNGPRTIAFANAQSVCRLGGTLKDMVNAFSTTDPTYGAYAGSKADYVAAINSIIAIYKAKGGTFPIGGGRVVDSSGNIGLPIKESVNPNGFSSVNVSPNSSFWTPAQPTPSPQATSDWSQCAQVSGNGTPCTNPGLTCNGQTWTDCKNGFAVNHACSGTEQCDTSQGCVPIPGTGFNCSGNACAACTGTNCQYSTAQSCINACSGGGGNLCTSTATAACIAQNKTCDPATGQCVGGGGQCQAPNTPCGSQCVNLQTDKNNCGICGKVCTICVAGIGIGCGGGGGGGSGDTCTQTAGQTCDAGTQCGIGKTSGTGTCTTGVCCKPAGGGTCQNPKAICNNVCTDVQNDNNNCGTCGTKCGAGLTCQQGNCKGGGTGNTTLAFISIGLDGIGSLGDNRNPDASGSNKNPNHKQRNVTVTIKTSDNTTVLDTQNDNITYNAVDTFTGTISLKSGFTTGDYRVLVKSPGYLQKAFPGTWHIVAGQTNTQPSAIGLTTGNIVDTGESANKFNIEDYNAFNSCYIYTTDQTLCTPEIRPLTQLYDKGVTDIDDYNLLLREFSVQNGDN